MPFRVVRLEDTRRDVPYASWEVKPFRLPWHPRGRSRRRWLRRRCRYRRGGRRARARKQSFVSKSTRRAERASCSPPRAVSWSMLPWGSGVRPDPAVGGRILPPMPVMSCAWCIGSGVACSRAAASSWCIGWARRTTRSPVTRRRNSSSAAPAHSRASPTRPGRTNTGSTSWSAKKGNHAGGRLARDAAPLRPGQPRLPLAYGDPVRMAVRGRAAVCRHRRKRPHAFRRRQPLHPWLHPVRTRGPALGLGAGEPGAPPTASGTPGTGCRGR